MNGRYSRPTPTPPLVLHHLDTLLHLRWNLHCRWVLSSPCDTSTHLHRKWRPRSREHQKMSTWRNKKQQIQYHNAAMSWKMHIQIQDHKHMARKCWKNLYSLRLLKRRGTSLLMCHNSRATHCCRPTRARVEKIPFPFPCFPFPLPLFGLI